MKKILFIMLSILALAIAGVVIFLLTFDPSRYQSRIEGKIQALVDRPVVIEEIKFGWDGRPQIIAEQVKFYPRQSDEASGPILVVDKLSVSIEFSSIFGKHENEDLFSMQIKNPRLEVFKNAEGGVFLPRTRISSMQVLLNRIPTRDEIHEPKLAVGKLAISKAEVEYIEESHGEQRSVVINNLDIVCGDVSFTAPIDFQATFTILGNEKNVAVNGRLVLVLEERKAYFESLLIQTDLGRINIQELCRFSPDLVDFGLSEASGILSVQGGPVYLEASRIAQSQVKVTLEKGSFLLTNSKKFRGDIHIFFEGSSDSVVHEQFFENLVGEGKIVFPQSIRLKANLLQKFFKAISFIPGLMNILESSLPRDSAQRLLASETVFKPMELNFTAQKSRIYFDNLALISSDFSILGRGSLDFGGSLDADVNIIIGANFTQDVCRIITQFEYLRSTNGTIEVPAKISGPLSDPRVKPNSDVIAGKLAGAVGQALLSGFVQQRSQSSASQGSSSQQQKADAYQQMISSFFN